MNRRLKLVTAAALVACAASLPLAGCSSSSGSAGTAAKTQIADAETGSPVVLEQCDAQFSTTTDDQQKQVPHKKFTLKVKNTSDKTIAKILIGAYNRDANDKTLTADKLTLNGPLEKGEEGGPIDLPIDTDYANVASELCAPVSVIFSDNTTWNSSKFTING